MPELWLSYSNTEPSLKLVKVRMQSVKAKIRRYPSATINTFSYVYTRAIRRTRIDERILSSLGEEGRRDERVI